MNTLHWPLSVLSRCIDYKNLTAASRHVGLSQPQLSRLIKQIEEELEISLLDRSSPRHSTWTPSARTVASIYKKSEKTLESELNIYLEDSSQKEVKIGCLEGLSGLAMASSSKILNKTKVTELTLNIYDLNILETKFLSGELDLIFTSREPNRKKYKHSKTLGYQAFESKKNTALDLEILSPFEEQTFKNKNKKLKKLISNSLAVRIDFQAKFGGRCSVPTNVQAQKSSAANTPVLVIGQDSLSKEIWKV